MFPKADHDLDHEDYLSKFPKAYIMQAVFTDHSLKKLEIENKIIDKGTTEKKSPNYPF